MITHIALEIGRLTTDTLDSYYAFCGTHHVPLDVDLVILEFDVNDQPCV